MISNSTTWPESRRRPVRSRRRIAAGAILTIVMSLLATAGGAQPARAAAGVITCPTGPGVTYGWAPLTLLGVPTDLGSYVVTQDVVDSVTPDFLVSEQHVVVNNTSSTITGTFTSSVAKTFGLTVTVGASASLFSLVTVSVSASIVMSTTTTTGVSATAPVPPFSSVTGQYGVRAYDIAYTVNTYGTIITNQYSPPPTVCISGGIPSQQGTAVAPTDITGWQVVPGG
jgi:hypothetical protein